MQELEQKVCDLQAIVDTQSKQISRMQNVLTQLLGGLFNPETQDSIRDLHIEIMCGYELSENEITCDKYPTTRQGDKLEKRVKVIETLISGLLDIINVSDIPKQYNTTTAILSQPEVAPQPDTNITIQIPQSNRIFNSFDLCGNN